MSQKYERILVAIDGSTESELAFEKAVNVALRNDSELILTHVIDTRALQSFATFDTYIYEKLEKEAKDVLEEYENKLVKKEQIKLDKLLNLVIPKHYLHMIFQKKKK